MPKKLNISSDRRKDWLERYNRGESQDAIAAVEKVNPRTVKAQIDRARIERSFEAAQQEQLGDALRKHQKDMLDLLKRTRKRIMVPSLDIDFGFGVTSEPPNRIVTLALEDGEGNAVIVTIRGGQPVEVHQDEEGSRLWRALRQHLGSKNTLWREITDWKRVLLKELQTRADLNQTIKKKLEEKSSVPILAQSSGKQPRLTPAIILPSQTEIVTRALGESPSDFLSRLEISGGSLNDPRTASYLTEYVEKPENVKEALAEVIQGLVASPEAKDMARAHQELAERTKKTRDELEDYELVHHIPGRCDLCKKLGGQ